MDVTQLEQKVEALEVAAQPRAIRAARWLWEHRTWVLLVLLVLAIVVCAHLWRRAAGAETRAAAAQGLAAEQAKQRDAKLAVFERVSQERVDAALAGMSDVKAALAAAEAEVGRMTVRYVIHASTAGAPVHAKPRPGETPPAGGPGAPTGAPPAGAAPAVVLRDGDALRLVLDAAVASGEHGSETLHGFAEAFRVSDGASITRQAISAPVTVLWEGPAAVCPSAAPERPWRAGPLGGASEHGWLVGGAYTRRLDVFGWKPEGLLAGGVGPGSGFLAAGILF